MTSESSHPFILSRWDFLVGAVLIALLVKLLSTWVLELLQWGNLIHPGLFLVAIPVAMVSYDAGALPPQVVLFPYVHNVLYYWELATVPAEAPLSAVPDQTALLLPALAITVLLGSLGYGLGLYLHRRQSVS